MNDAISRCELFNKLATIPAPPEANDFKAEVYKIIQQMETVESWISVNDRLPNFTIHNNVPDIGEWDESEPVLIYHNDSKFEGEILVAQYNNGFIGGSCGWTEYEEANAVYNVIAWMPLPKPWRDDEQQTQR